MTNNDEKVPNPLIKKLDWLAIWLARVVIAHFLQHTHEGCISEVGLYSQLRVELIKYISQYKMCLLTLQYVLLRHPLFVCFLFYLYIKFLRYKRTIYNNNASIFTQTNNTKDSINLNRIMNYISAINLILYLEGREVPDFHRLLEGP